MPDPFADFDFGRPFWTQRCAREAHSDCPHIFSPGGFDLRRLRLEPGARLCRCHSSCPVTPAAEHLTVPMKTWHSSCTCPGARQARRAMEEAGLEPLDPREQWQKAQQQLQAQKEATRAARPLPLARAARRSGRSI